MKNFLKNELPSLMVLLIPFCYLYYVWSDMPEKVAMHYNIKGEIDRYGSKEELLLIVFLLPVLTYLIFMAIPHLDPKKKIQLMGDKYHNFKFIMVLFMSLLSVYIIFTSHQNTTLNTKFFATGISAMFLILGNYMRNVKQNYFIGIRTPWTLENEQVWKEVHSMAGILWVVSGVIMIIISLIFPFMTTMIALMIVTTIATIVPVAQSYILFKKYSHEKS